MLHEIVQFCTIFNKHNFRVDEFKFMIQGKRGSFMNEDAVFYHHNVLHINKSSRNLLRIKTGIIYRIENNSVHVNFVKNILPPTHPARGVF